MWYDGNNASQYGDPDFGTKAVGLKKPNERGLYDMHGNVSEWCLNGSYNYSHNAIDPTGPDAPDDRMMRGGSWRDIAIDCRADTRVRTNPLFLSNEIGFRIVLTL